MGKDLFIDMIKDMIPWRQGIVLHYHEYYRGLSTTPEDPLLKYGILIEGISDQDFAKIKFEWIKFIKTRPNPDDRVADFEWRDKDGLPDFDKLERLIERRKTREEKQKELLDEMELKKAFDKHGLEYNGPLKDL